MYKYLCKFLIIASFIYISGCSSSGTKSPNIYDMSNQDYYQSNQSGSAQTPSDQNTIKPLAINDVPSTGAPIGGSVEKNMDKSDKNKMFHALDKAPGKTTTWKNRRTNIKFIVTPTNKLVINDNPYCRRYTTTAIRGNSTKQMTGIACVGSDGHWHSVN